MTAKGYTVFYIMLCAYIAASTTALVLVPFLGDAAKTAPLTGDQSAFLTMVATWLSVLAIAFTGAVAIYAVTLGNRDKQADRAIALLRILQTEPFISLSSKLQPFSDKDHNRTYHFDSWHKRQTLVVNGVPVPPMQPSEYGQSVVAVVNIFEEIYLHLKYQLVSESLVLEASSLVVLAFYYYLQPILGEIEDYTKFDFNNLRRLARKSQGWIRRNEPRPDASLLALDTSYRAR